MPQKRTLTPRQVRFCHEYLLNSNIGSSAIQAGYSLKNAYDIGKRLLKKPGVRAYLDELQAEQRAKYAVSAERIMEELCIVAFSDFADYLSWGNEILPLERVPELKRRAVAEVSLANTRNGSAGRIKLHNKLGALRLLGKHFSLFNKPVQITANQTQTVSIHATNPVQQNPEALSETAAAFDKASGNIFSSPGITPLQFKDEKRNDEFKIRDFLGTSSEKTTNG